MTINDLSPETLAKLLIMIQRPALFTIEDLVFLSGAEDARRLRRWLKLRGLLRQKSTREVHVIEYEALRRKWPEFWHSCVKRVRELADAAEDHEGEEEAA